MNHLRRIILHVGQTKAGSTSIQNYLDAERESLAASGVLFPTTYFERKNIFDPSRTAGSLSLIRQIYKNNVKEFDQELKDFDGHTLVLSAENLFSDQPDDVLSSLASYFDGLRIELVSVLRPQAPWIVARYRESVLSGFHSNVKSFSEFCSEHVERGSVFYYERLVRLSKLVNAHRVRVIDYECCLKNNNLIEKFLEASSLPLTNPKLAKSLHSNARSSVPELVEAKRRLNILTMEMPLIKRLEIEANFLKNVSFATSEEGVRVSKFTFEEPDLAALEKSNEKLSRHFMNGSGFSVSPELSSVVVSGDEAKTRALFLNGIKVAVGIIREDRLSNSGEKIQDNILTKLSPEVLDALACSDTSSLHLNSPATAIISALLRTHGGPVILVEPETSTTYSNGELLDNSLQSCEIVHLPAEDICNEEKMRCRAIDVLSECHVKIARLIFISSEVALSPVLKALIELKWEGDIIVENAMTFLESDELDVDCICIKEHLGKAIRLFISTSAAENEPSIAGTGHTL